MFAKGFVFVTDVTITAHALFYYSELESSHPYNPIGLFAAEQPTSSHDQKKFLTYRFILKRVINFDDSCSLVSSSALLLQSLWLICIVRFKIPLHVPNAPWPHATHANPAHTTSWTWIRVIVNARGTDWWVQYEWSWCVIGTKYGRRPPRWIARTGRVWYDLFIRSFDL